MSGSSVGCPICWEDFTVKINEDSIISLKCGHIVHLKCLDEWRKTSMVKKCPYCDSNYSSVKTLKKIYPTIVPKDEDEKITNLKSEVENLLKTIENEREEMERLRNKNEELEFKLTETQRNNNALQNNYNNIKRDFTVKTEIFELENAINNNYLKENTNLLAMIKSLKDEKSEVENRLKELRSECTKTSKTFIDLTEDDDGSSSDIEFIEEKFEQNNNHQTNHDNNGDMIDLGFTLGQDVK